MLEQVLVTLMVVIGITLAEALVAIALGYYNNPVAGFVELVCIIVLISMFSQSILVQKSFLVLLAGSFMVGFFPALIVKLVLSLYIRRKHPEERLKEKSLVIQLIRSLRIEKLSKSKIKRSLKRIGVDTEKYIKFF